MDGWGASFQQSIENGGSYFHTCTLLHSVIEKLISVFPIEGCD